MTNKANLRPAADYPGGGYAIVRIDDPLGVSTTAHISIFDLFRERYLGPHEWQPDAHDFGPYPTTPTPDGVAMEICIGPEIVNQIAEFTSILIEIGGHATTLTWPDNVLQDPRAQPYGTIYKEPDPTENLSDTVQRPVEDAAFTDAKDAGQPEDDDAQTVDEREPSVTPPPAEPQKRSFVPLLIGLLLVAILGGLGIWLFTKDQGATTEAEPEPEPVETAVACTIDNALNGGLAPLEMLAIFADRSDVGTCDPAIDANFALRLTEQAAVNGSADALAAIGDIYNPFYSHPLLTDRLAVTLSDDAAIAVDYYRRAIAAGGGPSEDALSAFCEGTSDSADIMLQQDRQELCE